MQGSAEPAGDAVWVWFVLGNYIPAAQVAAREQTLARRGFSQTRLGERGHIVQEDKPFDSI